MTQTSIDLGVQLNRLSLKNPILVASGTFGYAREMTSFIDFSRLGGIIPKTVTMQPRAGNPPPRTVETTAGLLNSIGLDNDGLETFIDKHLDYLCGLDTAIIANIAARNMDELAQMAERLNAYPQLAGVELNISCPNVSGGVDFGTNPEMAHDVVKKVRNACDLPIIAKLTPNVTSIASIAQAVAEAGTDAVSLVNTFQGTAINWRSRKPILGAVFGGLSGPAIKPLALRAVCQVARAVDVPIIGIGGISNIDDVMEFLVAGASAVQIGTASFYNPGLSAALVEQLEETLASENCSSVKEIIGSLQYPEGR
ncbi:Dihydroorotate dehydrogenase B (NAD(+)), catalytic subunit [Polystyrenella longa]|uniref:Dihydroorotate dehydrogenase n=1 Tax=Polystyrenella longa TaxID=2528007 RepID=A0A518CMW1_9PLAN|nr:dihydroorotate dehydrogenase [Polystyrenella longa]QDU80555.1 Dihydroorotate dehydrogenase B (NAD(+)), catalytic subunit [Polystyrenella longa]